MEKRIINMSGGSYQYLCQVDLADLFAPRGRSFEMMGHMATALSGYGYDHAAQKTRQIAEDLRAWNATVFGGVSEDEVETEEGRAFERRLDRLRPLWRAVEWYESLDTDFPSVEEAHADYLKNA